MTITKQLVLTAYCQRCDVQESEVFAVDDAKAVPNFRAHLVEIGWRVDQIALCVDCHAEALRRQKGAA